VSDYELRVHLQEPEFASRVCRVLASFDAYLKDTGTWGHLHAPALHKNPVAYFTAEFGFHETLPIAAGGLVILADDHAKSASDLGLGFVGISLFYREGYFQQAIELDPAYAPGYAGLSEYYGLSSALGMMPGNEGWPLAEAAMMKAQELDDTLPEIHNGLAAIRMFYYRDWQGAEREIKRTIELNAEFPEVHLLHSYCLVVMGRLDELGQVSDHPGFGTPHTLKKAVSMVCRC
jgi:hypothetical protein